MTNIYLYDKYHILSQGNTGGVDLRFLHARNMAGKVVVKKKENPIRKELQGFGIIETGKEVK